MREGLPRAHARDPGRRDVGGDARRPRRAARVPPCLIGGLAPETQQRRGTARATQRRHEAGEHRVAAARRAEVVEDRPVLERQAGERRRDPRPRPRAEGAHRDAARGGARRAQGRHGGRRRHDGGARLAVVGHRPVRGERDDAPAQRPRRNAGQRSPRRARPGATPPDVDRVGAAWTDLAPDRLPGEVDPQRVGGVRERGLRVAVGVDETGLPAGVGPAAADGLVDPGVLREELDAGIAPRHVGGLREIAILLARGHAALAVGRVGLVAVLVQPQPQRPRGADEPARGLQAVEEALERGQAGEVGVVGVVVGLVRRQPRAVRVIREPVGDRGLEVRAAAAAKRPQALVDAAERAQELQRAHVRVAAHQAAPARRQGADQDLRVGVGRVDGRIGGSDQRAVAVARHGRAAPLDARGLRLQPERQIGLVPEDVLAHVGPVAPRDRGREGGELRADRPSW